MQMADIDKMLDKHLQETERFTPLPDRTMYGKQYRNVPFDMWVGNTGVAPFDPRSTVAPKTDYISTDEEGRALLWQLRQLLSN
jgi:hypothetical protein